VRADWTISTAVHVSLITLGLVSFTWTKPRDADTPEFIAVNVVSDKDTSQLTAGVKNAPKVIEEAKPLADKVGETKPIKQLAPKVADKPEVTTDAGAAPPPKPEPKPVEKTEKPKPPEFKPDQIAEELKKDETKKPAKPKWAEFKPDQIAEQLKKDEPKKQTTKFDANQVAALLDKRDARRQVATGETLNPAASLGAANGHAAQLSQSELDALRARLSQCWSPPPGIEATTKIYVVLRVLFKQDGSIAREPNVIEDTGSALGPALTESAKRALLMCQPFTMLKPEHYDQWKDIEIKFDPQELLGG
jgi:outer membrane biosynthesis protein TonB